MLSRHEVSSGEYFVLRIFDACKIGGETSQINEAIDPDLDSLFEAFRRDPFGHPSARPVSDVNFLW